MKDSFYYFFSATPQVLGAILALFGVFVIFKIDNLYKRLKSIGGIISGLYSRNLWERVFSPGKKVEKKILFDRVLQGESLHTLLVYVKTFASDILLLSAKLQDNIKEEEKGNPEDEKEISKKVQRIKSLNHLIESINSWRLYPKSYTRLYDSLKTIIRDTIIWSIYTASLIVICLVILSHSVFFLCNPLLLSITFWMTTVFIAGCFLGLIIILRKSLKES